MRMLAGVLPPDAGSATVAGCDVVRDPEGVKHHISYMPQRFGLYEDLTVDENIRFYADLFGVGGSEREARATAADACGMSQFRSAPGRQAFRRDEAEARPGLRADSYAAVLLLDEPTNGVDPVSRREFWAMLYSLAGQGVTDPELHRVSRRGRAMPSRRADASRTAALLRYARAAQGAAPGPVVVDRVVRARAGCRDELDRADGVSSLVLVGDAVHLFVDDADRRIADLARG